MSTNYPSITCPRCGMTSYNRNDIAQRYCGNCHEFHDDRVIGYVACDKPQTRGICRKPLHHEGDCAPF